MADAIGRRATISHVHWGGGTPTTLPPQGRDVIERIICNLAVDLDAVAGAHGADLLPLHDAAKTLASFERDELVTQDGSLITITPVGRPFVRNVAAVFDAYLAHAPVTPRHSKTV